MASIKVKYKPSSVEGCEGTIFYQIIHDRKVRQLFSNYHVLPSEWNEKHSSVMYGANSGRCQLIQSIKERVRWDLERLVKIVRNFDDSGVNYTSDDVVEEFNRYSEEGSLFNFMENTIVKLKQNGKVRTYETYRATLSSFRKFLITRQNEDTLSREEDIMLHEISSEIIESYQSWLYNIGVAPNTVSFYMRILRATYNRAVEEGKVENRHPFRHVYTGVDKTIKRALPIQYIRKIKALDLSLSPSLDFARDMFLLSFMFRGMSFVDMAYLRKSDLSNGSLSYRRRKTGQLLIIEWTRDMQQILNKYPGNSSAYLLPIICEEGTDERKVYRNMGEKVNYHLKRLGEQIGLKMPLTLYVARHSWASVAKAKGIPVGVISEGMGHDSEMTTQIYLASLDTSVVNKANRLILSSI